jgi:hypothetical protein
MLRIRSAGLGRRARWFGVVIALLALPAAASAKLPSPRHTLIVPGESIAGVALGMNQAQVFHRWGHTSCFSRGQVCYWYGPGSQVHAERASVGFTKGKVLNVAISAGTRGNNLKFVPGPLARWKTDKGIHLGSFKGSVRTAYRSARANDSEGVKGFDLLEGRITTRFSSFGIGANPDQLRYIQIYCVPTPSGGGCP